MIILLNVLLGLAGRLHGAPSCAECTCNWERDPLKARDGAAAVVEALALDNTVHGQPLVDSNGLRYYSVRLLAGRVWKGAIRDTVTVRTTEPSGGCGFQFAAGVHYLLFLYKDDSHHLLATMCSLSQPLNEARSLVEILERPAGNETNANKHAQRSASWGVAVMPFEASAPRLQPQADSARAHVVSVLRGAGIRLVNRPPSKADAGSLVPARFAVVGTLTAKGDSINVDAKLINVETAATVRRVNLTGPFRGAAALGEMVGRIVSLDVQAAWP